MRKSKLNIYAAYKGDEFIAEGNVYELEKILGIKASTIYCMQCPSYMQNRRKRIVIKVDDEDE